MNGMHWNQRSGTHSSLTPAWVVIKKSQLAILSVAMVVMVALFRVVSNLWDIRLKWIEASWMGFEVFSLGSISGPISAFWLAPREANTMSSRCLIRPAPVSISSPPQGTVSRWTLSRQKPSCLRLSLAGALLQCCEKWLARSSVNTIRQSST